MPHAGRPVQTYKLHRRVGRCTSHCMSETSAVVCTCVKPNSTMRAGCAHHVFDYFCLCLAVVGPLKRTYTNSPCTSAAAHAAKMTAPHMAFPARSAKKRSENDDIHGKSASTMFCSAHFSVPVSTCFAFKTSSIVFGVMAGVWPEACHSTCVFALCCPPSQQKIRVTGTCVCLKCLTSAAQTQRV